MGGQSNNSESTFLELGWNSPHVAVGIGYDFGFRQIRSSPFADKLPLEHDMNYPQSVDATKKDILISSIEDKKEALKFESSITIPIKGSELKLENSWLSSVETSDTRFYQVMLDAPVDPPMKTDLVSSKPKLSDKAQALMQKGWTEFTKVYGEYFVYGYIARASFRAVIDIKTSSKKTAQELKSKLSVNIQNKASFEAAFSKLSESTTETAEVSVDITQTGLGSAFEKERRQRIKDDGFKEEKFSVGASQAYTAYQDWCNNYEKKPWKALLCHYSVICEGVPTPQEQFAHLGDDIKTLYEDLFNAQIDLSSSQMRGAITTSEDAASAIKRLLRIEPADVTALNALKKDAADIQTDVKKWRARERLIDTLKNNKPAEGELKQNVWIEGADGKRFYTYGLLDSWPPSSSYYILNGDREIISDNRHESNSAGYNGSISRCSASNKILIGFEFQDNWADGTNGWFRWLSGNLGDSWVEAEWSSYSGRGYDWQLNAAFISKELYEKVA